MISSKEIRHNLLEMYSKIEAIRNHDNLKTSKALESLKKELDQIRKNESDQIKKKLHNLVINLSSIREKEQCGIRKRLQGLSYNLSLIRNKEVDDCRRELQSLSVNLSLIRRKEFSFMKVFGLENNELVHSCVLAWLLDPLESHNLGSLFVERFLLKMGLKVDEFDFSKFHVEREISSDKSRLDIRIFDSNGKFQCIIENKIWSSEGNDQTKRLYSDFHGKSYERELFIFLTLNKKQPDDKHFVMMNYEQILQILAELWEVSVGDTRFLIKHYSNTLERLIMAEKFEGFSERTQLYYQYYKDTTEVNKAFIKDRELLLKTLEAAVKETKWWDENVWKLQRGGGDIDLWKDSWRLNKDEGLYIQLYMYTESPGFAIRIWGEPSAFATKLMPIFKKLIDKKYPGKMAAGLIKRFTSGVSRFLEKEIIFSLTEKTQLKKMLENLDNIIELFDETMIKSINELKQNK